MKPYIWVCVYLIVKSIWLHVVILKHREDCSEALGLNCAVAGVMPFRMDSARVKWWIFLRNNLLTTTLGQFLHDVDPTPASWSYDNINLSVGWWEGVGASVWVSVYGIIFVASRFNKWYRIMEQEIQLGWTFPFAGVSIQIYCNVFHIIEFKQ